MSLQNPTDATGSPCDTPADAAPVRMMAPPPLTPATRALLDQARKLNTPELTMAERANVYGMYPREGEARVYDAHVEPISPDALVAAVADVRAGEAPTA